MPCRSQVMNGAHTPHVYVITPLCKRGTKVLSGSCVAVQTEISTVESMADSAQDTLTALPDVAVTSGRDHAAHAASVPDQSNGEPKQPDRLEKWWHLKMNWQGSVYDLRIESEDMVYDFRTMIYSLTAVPAERQKLIGLTKGKLPTTSDADRFGTLGIPYRPDGPAIKFTMVGTPEKDTFIDPTEQGTPEVYDDFDVAYGSKAEPARTAPCEDKRNKRKIKERCEKIPITVINEPRPGKKLLVLDLDYTIIDTEPLLTGRLPAEECARPGLHSFLEAAYEDYELVIWSQTHWRWLEAKLVELGMLGGPWNYRICFVSDSTSMFTIFSKRNGKDVKHEVKPLAYLWNRFPQWSAKNTIHIDDLSRNFAMNPGEGLKIRPFKGAGTPRGGRDKELIYLGQYLSRLAKVDDFQTVDHAVWRDAYGRTRDT